MRMFETHGGASAVVPEGLLASLHLAGSPYRDSWMHITTHRAGGYGYSWDGLRATLPFCGSDAIAATEALDRMIQGLTSEIRAEPGSVVETEGLPTAEQACESIAAKSVSTLEELIRDPEFQRLVSTVFVGARPAYIAPETPDPDEPSHRMFLMLPTGLSAREANRRLTDLFRAIAIRGTGILRDALIDVDYD